MIEHTFHRNNNTNPIDNHWAVFIDNNSNKNALIEQLIQSKSHSHFKFLTGLNGSLFSKIEVNRFIDEESRHGTSGIIPSTTQSLQTMSSGEQKKALLTHILKTKPDFIVLDNPFDNLDVQSQKYLGKRLKEISAKTFLIQIISRKNDLLPFISNFAQLNQSTLKVLSDFKTSTNKTHASTFKGQIPLPLVKSTYIGNPLIELKNINVSYLGRPVLKNISWRINNCEFWELCGENGSGKTTILSMITGENPKGYGQDLFLFGFKKGSGESVWDIKKNIGYFTPSMTDKFTGYHTVEQMIISGILDSIGLYIRPNEAQLRLAKEWLTLINMWSIKDALFHDLSMGQKRLIMTTRAMIKHPPLLILDEPTAGLDDQSAELLVALVNKMAKESNTSIIFVSHRKESGLAPLYQFKLKKTPNGSIREA